MAEVLRSRIIHDGEVFEAGSPASKLPKAVRETARNNGFLIPGPKKAKAEPEPETENDEDEGTEDSVPDEDEPGDKE